VTFGAFDGSPPLWFRPGSTQSMELALAIQAFIILALLQKFVFSK